MTVSVMLHVVIAVGGLILARLLTSVTQVLLARRMGLADFGVYTSVYTLLGPAIMLASLGLDTWLLRQSHDPAALASYISEVIWLRVFTAVALMLVSIPIVLLNGDPSITFSITLLAALGLICELLLTTSHTILRAQLRNYAAALLQVLVAGLLILLIWLFWSDQAPLVATTSYRLLASLVGVTLMVWLLRHNVRFVWQPSTFWKLIQQGRIYYAADLLANITGKADLTIVALLLGTVAAGTYGPALTIINTTFLIPTVLWQVFLPILARQPTGSRSFRWTMGIHLVSNVLYGLFWAALVFFGAKPLIELIFGVEYRDAIVLLQIMSLIPLLKSINFCLAIYMVVRDRQGLRAMLLAVSAAVNMAGNLIAIPLFGLVGAAWVNLITEIITFGCYAYGAWVAKQRHQ
jgi:O-antigen/teichoic acid export membrane protein